MSISHCLHRRWRTLHRGFTLVEVMVALAIMAMVTALSWQGIEAVMQSQERSRQHSRELAILQTVLAQWESDFNHIDFSPGAQLPIGVANLHYDKDKQYLRLVRWDESRGDRALQVVAWAKRADDGSMAATDAPGTWLRWQSPSVFTQLELEGAWEQAEKWATDSDADSLRRYEQALLRIQEWELLVFGGTDWAEEAQSIVPRRAGRVRINGLRLILSPADGSLFAGPITRDWINPTAPSL